MRAGYKVGALSALVVAAVWVSGQTQGQPKGEVFREIGGDLVIWSADGKLSFEFGTESGTGSTFDGAGNPLYMRSPSRGIDAATKTLKAFFKEQANGQLGFSTATLSGAVNLTLKRGEGETNIKTERATITEGDPEATLTLPGAATLAHKEAGGGFNSRFGSGTAKMAPLKSNSKDSFRSAQLRGGTTTNFSQTGARSSSEGTLKSDAVNITKQAANTFEAIFSQRFTLDGSSKSTSGATQTQDLNLAANSGEVTYLTGLKSAAPDPATGQQELVILKAMRLMTAKGNISFKLVSVAPRPKRESDPANAGPILEQTITEATGDNLTYDSETMTMVLTGNVWYKQTRKDVGSTAEPTGMEQTMSRLTVVFDMYGRVKSAKGGSGTLRSTGGIPPQ